MLAIAETFEAPAPLDGAIRNPSNPHHFMVIKPVIGRARVHIGDRLLADTDDAVWVIEIGQTAYDPRLYVPSRDLLVALDRTDKTTHCPIKGDASYYAVNGEEIGWSYLEPVDFALALTGRFAFWPSRVRIELGG